MANFTPFYIPSRSRGKVWRIYFHKPNRRPAYVAAQEGESRDGIFTTALIGSRHLTVGMPGRATLRAVTDAGRELLRQLADSGCISADAVDEFTPRLVK